MNHAITGLSRSPLNTYPSSLWACQFRSHRRPGVKTVQRTQVKIAFLAVIVAVAATCRAAGSSAAVSGVVRDAQGVAEMGALVQVLAQNSVMVGTAFTDLHGRYLISNLIPGKYEVRATAALFVPALRGNLQLRPGAQAVVEPDAERAVRYGCMVARRAAQGGRAEAMTGSGRCGRLPTGLSCGWLKMARSSWSSSSATEAVNPWKRTRASVTSGDGGFGNGGVHNVLSMDRVMDDGGRYDLRADIGAPAGPFIRGPSMELAAGYQRRLGFAGAARTVVSYQSHPEMVGSGGASGLDIMQTASAQKTNFGDTAELEVGSAVYVVRSAGYAVASRPFLRVTVHPVTGSAWGTGWLRRVIYSLLQRSMRSRWSCR